MSIRKYIILFLGLALFSCQGDIQDPEPISINCDFCFGGSSLLDADGVGGTAPYVYDWTGGSSGPTLSVSSSGSYFVTVTDINGCTVTDEYVVTELPELVVPITESSCMLTAAPTGGTGSGYTYLWNTSETTSSITADMDITYSVTVTDSNGCIGVGTFVVTGCECTCMIVQQPVLEVCENTPYIVSGITTGCVGTISYCWIPIAGTCVGGTDMDAPAAQCSCGSTPPCTTGAFVLEVTDANGCFDSYSYPIMCFGCTCNVTTEIVGDGDICPSETNVLTATGSSNSTTTYNWSASNGGTISGSTTGSQIDATSIGTYCVTVTETQGTPPSTCNDTDCFDIVAGTCCSMTVSVTEVNCVVTAVPSNGSGGYTYSWTPSGSGNSFTATTDGFYSVTVTDSNGCTAVGGVNVLNCNGGPCNMTSSISLSGCDLTVNQTGGVPAISYLWNNGLTSQTITNQTNGNFSVTVTDSNGCTSVSTAVLFGCAACDCNLSVTVGGCQATALLSGPDCSNYNLISITDGCNGGNTLAVGPSPFTFTVPDNGDYEWLANGNAGCPNLTECLTVTTCCETCDYEIVPTNTSTTTGCDFVDVTGISGCDECGDAFVLTVDYEIKKTCPSGTTFTPHVLGYPERAYELYLRIDCSEVIANGVLDMNSGSYTIPSTINDCAALASWIESTFPSLVFVSGSTKINQCISSSNSDGFDINGINSVIGRWSSSCNTNSSGLETTDPCGQTLTISVGVSNQALTVGIIGSGDDVEVDYNSIVINNCIVAPITINSSNVQSCCN